MRLVIKKTAFLFVAHSLLMALTLVQGVTAAAETMCKSELGFKWKPGQEPTELAEYWSTIKAKGVDEKTAKEALAVLVDKEKSVAQRACRERHEDLTGCVAGKLSALRPTLQAMGYSERRTLESAVNSDCTARQGKCGEITVSEAQCVVSSAGDKAAEGAAEEKGGKKEEKAKKK